MNPVALKPADEWRKLHPGVRALILMYVGGGKPNVSFILPADAEAPEGRHRLLGVLE